MSTIYIKDNGAWKQVKEMWIKKDGVWTNPTKVYVNNAGSFTQVYPNQKLLAVTSPAYYD